MFLNEKNSIGDIPPKPCAADEVVQMGGGYAFPDLLPDVSKIAQSVALNFRDEAMQYGPLYGLSELRYAITEYVKNDGVICSHENIIVLNGAKQALDLLLRATVKPGDFVVVSRPTYLTALSIIRGHGAELIEVDVDEHGMQTDVLAEILASRKARGDAMPKLLFEVPDFHNPTGVTLSEARRRQVLALAQEYHFYILEDDPYRRLRFSGNAVRPIKAFDTTGHVIGAGTVSKVFAPGIRVGWANGHSKIINRMAKFKSEGGCCPLTQRIVLDAMRGNVISQHIAQLSKIMVMHRDAMCRSLDTYLPELQYRAPDGGYFIWLKLPAGMAAERVKSAARFFGVEVFSGDQFFASSPSHGYLRLCFSYSNLEEINLGVKRLADAISHLRNWPNWQMPEDVNDSPVYTN